MSKELETRVKGPARLWIRITAFLSLKTPNTRKTYTGIIAEWCSFLGTQVGTEEAARKILAASDLHAMAYRRWLESRPGEKPRALRKIKGSPSREVTLRKRSSNSEQKKSGLEDTQSNATISKKFAALRRIYRMLIAADLGVLENPFDVDKVPPPAKEAGRKRPTEMVSFDRVMDIIYSPPEETEKGIRDRAILASLFGGGIRRSELINLRIDDVRRTHKGTLYLYLRNTKGKKDAEQALPAWAADLVDRHLAIRKAAGAGPADFLFTGYIGQAGITATSEPISESGVYHLFRKYCSLGGGGSFLTPHSARATAITKLLEDGLSHREVQEFSRHASVQMVEVYDKRRYGIEQNPAKGLDFNSKKSSDK